MKVSLGNFLVTSMDDLIARLIEFARDLEDAFDDVADNVRITHDVELNFSAPGAVPGITSQNVTIEGVEMGDTVLVGASIAVPAGFLPPYAAVTAANTVTVYWAQLTGAAADPDSTGATYTLDIWRH